MIDVVNHVSTSQAQMRSQLTSLVSLAENMQIKMDKGCIVQDSEQQPQCIPTSSRKRARHNDGIECDSTNNNNTSTTTTAANNILNINHDNSNNNSSNTDSSAAVASRTVCFKLINLPSQKIKTMHCTKAKPIDPPDLSPLSIQQKERYLSIKSSIQHSWNGYYTTVLKSQPYYQKVLGILPSDNLAPLSKKGIRWLHSAATLFDSLDTLYIANLNEEYEDALQIALKLPLPLYPTKTFEYSIRVLGGLLGAYSVSGDNRLLKYSQRVADSLLDGPFRSSPTVLPRMYDVLSPSPNDVNLWNWGGMLIHRSYAFIYRRIRDWLGEHVHNSLAGFGTFTLEFGYLTKVTNEDKYKKASDEIYQHVTQYSNNKQKHNSIPMFWNVMTGTPSTTFSGLGSGSDSYYEYLIKNYILMQEEKREEGQDQRSVEQSMLKSYLEVIDDSLLSRGSNGVYTKYDDNTNQNIMYPVETSSHYQHLLCFIPGMLALGHTFVNDEEYPNYLSSSHVDIMTLAINMTEGCWDTYQNSKTGLGPETLYFDHLDLPVVTDSGYYLRPEFVESIFVLYRVTKDERYQDIAWEVFQSLESFCKNDIGYFGLMDVNNDQESNLKDEMPSFFIAETLKYLLLTFAPHDYISLNDFVFTTEAHPLRRVSTMREECDGDAGSQDQSFNLTVAPILSLTANILLGLGLYMAFNSLFRRKKMEVRDKKIL
mmetsp:Transcript_13039/g.15898  ORF Transcript_13039/g.15898 Transcript_13039/m.15898 type:complete len:708 (-) Transcript_13039:46-2169(-)